MSEVDEVGVMERSRTFQFPIPEIIWHRAAEDKIGVMLPCNVILQEVDNKIEVAAVDPIASMQGVENTELGEIAHQVQTKLKRVIENL